MPDYLIDGERLAGSDADFAPALACAYADHRRPRCLCSPHGPEMYVVRLGARFIVKRMPGTGSLHAPYCPSYELPEGLSGLTGVLRTAIREKPDTGTTRLRLDFALSKGGTETRAALGDASPGSVVRPMPGLTLRGLLHYLWDEAGLTRWQPGFVGRRSWATVHKRLLAAAEGKQACGRRLEDVLFIPEPFYAEHSMAIAARRTAQWARATTETRRRHPLLLLLGEVKEFVPTRFGHVVVMKHLPDQPFGLGQDLYRRLVNRFEPALLLWGATPALHMILLATFEPNRAGPPTIEEVLLMPTNGQWIPIDDAWDLQLLDQLQQDGRTFARCLRYDAPKPASIPTAVLLDTLQAPCPLSVERDPLHPGDGLGHEPAGWTWQPGRSEMPALPAKAELEHSQPERACHLPEPVRPH